MDRTAFPTCGLSLRRLLPDARFLGDADICVRSVSSDSGKLRDGDLYVALVEAERDGHDTVEEAVRRGASAILAERLVPAGVPVCIVGDTRAALGRICQTLAGNPSRRMRVVGVTGTAGKTVVSNLIAAIFEAAEQTVGVTCSLGYSDSREVAPAPQTTPDAAELARWLARMENNGCTHAVVELSSQALAEHRAAGVELSAAVVTNVRRDHLDLHGSVLNYRKIKGRIFDHLGPHGFVVLNADDPASNHYLTQVRHPLMTVGMRVPAELTAEVVERRRSEQTFLLCAGSDTIPVRTRMIGDHHVTNCLQAAAVGLCCGVDIATVVRGLERLEQIPGRLERIECGQPFGVFLDQAATPDALAVSLKALRAVTRGRLICIFSAGRDMPRDLRPLLGRVAERGANLGIITAALHEAGTAPLHVAHDILDGYERPARAHVLPSRRRAIAWALGEAAAGDCVLIAGGNDLRSEEEDREQARRCLYAAGKTANLRASA